MNFLKNRTKTEKQVALVAAVVLIIVAACAIYLGDYYHADMDAVSAFSIDCAVEMDTSETGNLVWKPKQATSGFIFYPGGKVEHTAYIPLMEELSSRGVLCVLVKMPFHLAVFDINAADGIQETFPQIEHWYIGGHSLGGAMAASYVSNCEQAFEGLVLLGSYSTEDLSQTDLSVLSIYGSEDLVMNREKYEETRDNLPVDYQEIVVDGGCHAYFGMYGQQEGDGIPTISNKEQIIWSVDAIAAMMAQG